MCGFIHSTLVTEPVSLIGLAASNSAAKEWCAIAGTDASSNPRPAAAKASFVLIEQPPRRNAFLAGT